MAMINARQYLIAIDTLNHLANQLGINFRMGKKKSGKKGGKQEFDSVISVISDEPGARKLAELVPYKLMMHPKNVSGQGWTTMFDFSVAREIKPLEKSDPHRPSVMQMILLERQRQEDLKRMGKFEYTCADRELFDSAKLAILVEEVGEVAKALNEDGVDPSYSKALRDELVQVATVCAAWLESMGIPLNDSASILFRQGDKS